MAARVGLDREQVVSVAARIADTEGLDALTLVRLANELGVKYQSLYSHVANLTALHQQLQIRYCTAKGDVCRRAAVGLAGRDALVAIAYAHQAFVIEHPGLTEVHWKLGVGDGSLTPLFDEAASALITVLRSYGLRGEDLVHRRRAFAAVVFGFASLQNANLLCSGPDNAITFDLLITNFIDAVEADSIKITSKETI